MNYSDAGARERAERDRGYAGGLLSSPHDMVGGRMRQSPRPVETDAERAEWLRQADIRHHAMCLRDGIWSWRNVDGVRVAIDHAEELARLQREEP